MSISIILLLATPAEVDNPNLLAELLPGGVLPTVEEALPEELEAMELLEDEEECDRE